MHRCQSAQDLAYKPTARAAVVLASRVLLAPVSAMQVAMKITIAVRIYKKLAAFIIQVLYNFTIQ